jgi:hypothetical protein
MMDIAEKKLYQKAYLLSLFTIFYNLAEGIISMVLGYEDETLTLFGFGVDSFIEVMSGIGIAVMIRRIRQNPASPKSEFEIKALKVTGTAFYLLSVGLLAGIVNCSNDLADECQKIDRQRAAFRPYHCRCQLYQSVRLHVGGIVDFEPDIPTDWIRLFRRDWRCRIDLVLGF